LVGFWFVGRHFVSVPEKDDLEICGAIFDVAQLHNPKFAESNVTMSVKLRAQSARRFILAQNQNNDL
jgi:hypothetical protein